MNKDIDKEIVELQKKLDEWSLVNEEFIPKTLKSLNYNIIHTSAWLDYYLDIKIGLYLTEDLSKAISQEDRLKVVKNLEPIVSPINFERKVQIACDLKILDSKLITAIKQINFLKNAFSHPQILKYARKLFELKRNKSALLIEMQNIQLIRDALNNLMKFYKTEK